MLHKLLCRHLGKFASWTKKRDKDFMPLKLFDSRSFEKTLYISTAFYGMITEYLQRFLSSFQSD